MRKIVYIVNGISGIGGLERVLSIKASYFADALNYEVHIVTLNDDASSLFYHFSDKITFHNVQTKRGCLYIPSYIAGINKVITQIEPDVISVCDDGLKGLFVPLWIKKKKASIIYERHASMTLNAGRLAQKLMQFGGRLYDKVVVLTQYNVSEWNSNNVVVIPNPLSFYPAEVSSLSEKRIICVGSISYNKGYDLLIEAWARIASKYPEWRIDIFGKGDVNSLESLAQRKGVADSLSFCGPTRNVMLEYLNSSIFALPSRSEGFGMVLIEAMACGLPCVSFDCPCGPRDIIENGKNGLLVPPEDVQKLACALQKLMDSTETRNQQGAYGRECAKKYGIEQIARQWVLLFESIKKL